MSSAFDSFDLDSDPAPSVVKPTILVPNAQPSIPPSTYRIAIIGDCPNEDDELSLRPFLGMPGKFLDKRLSALNIVRARCFVGNVCQVRPRSSDVTEFEVDGPEVAAGLETLAKDLALFEPNICILLGRLPLYAALGTHNLGDWRGSVFVSQKNGPFSGRKCIASYRPSDCFKQFDNTPLLMADLAKALKHSNCKTHVPPLRYLDSRISYVDLCNRLDSVLLTKPKISCDIEGGVSSVSCISIALHPSSSFIVPFTKLDGSSYWTVDEEVVIWRKLAAILADPSIGKVWQNGLYDRFVLQWSHDILIRNNVDDTMLKFWEQYCELEKSLGFQCSILTDEPFYKSQRHSQDQDEFYRYCCTDSAVTMEISNRLDSILTPPQKDHYTFNNDCLNFLLYAELRGMCYNHEEANRRLEAMQENVSVLQNTLDEIAERLGALTRIDFSLPNSEILSKVQSILCYKKDPSRPKKGNEKDYNWIRDHLNYPRPLDEPLDPQTRGAIAIACGMVMNTKSSKKFQDFLYKTCKLPTQWKKDPKTKEMKITTNYEALLRLSKNSNHPALSVSLDLSRLRTRCQMLAIVPYRGRMHCSYNLVGSETGRVTSSKSLLHTVDGRVGGNMQTIPDDWEVFDKDHPIHQGMRDLFIADEGCYLGKADLKGADGWTIGAYMAMLGDRTMLDDLLYGIKPAQVVAFILIHGEAEYRKYAHDRAALVEACKCVKKDMWEYFVSKIGIWGTFYTMGPRSLGNNVFIQSEGKVNLSESQSRDFQKCILVRYNAPLWQRWMERFLQSQPYPAKLVSPNNHVRQFFGRNSKLKCEILGEALAHVPQVVTTYATLLAARNLWCDPDNRIPNPSGHGSKLRIEPLHQVHDELVVQWKIEDTAWALGKIRQYFNNEIEVAKQKIIIPYDGAYGTNWSMDEKGKVGTI